MNSKVKICDLPSTLEELNDNYYLAASNIIEGTKKIGLSSFSTSQITVDPIGGVSDIKTGANYHYDDSELRYKLENTIKESDSSNYIGTVLVNLTPVKKLFYLEDYFPLEDGKTYLMKLHFRNYSTIVYQPSVTACKDGIIDYPGDVITKEENDSGTYVNIWKATNAISGDCDADYCTIVDKNNSKFLINAVNSVINIQVSLYHFDGSTIDNQFFDKVTNGYSAQKYFCAISGWDSEEYIVSYFHSNKLSGNLILTTDYINNFSYFLRSNVGVSSICMQNLISAYSMYSAFNSMQNLTSISFPTLSNAYKLNYLVSNCPNLKSVDLSKLEKMEAQLSSGKIKTGTMGHAFEGCSSLTNVNLNGLTSIQTKMLQSSFCSSNKKYLKLSSMSFDNVISCDQYGLQETFGNNINLISCSFPKLSRCAFDAFYRTFDSCSSLVSVNLPMLSTCESKAFNYTFVDCSSLITFEVPELTVADNTTDNMSLFYNAFKRAGLKKFSAPKLEYGYSLCNAFVSSDSPLSVYVQSMLKSNSRYSTWDIPDGSTIVFKDRTITT